jgi:hypothetical protein
MEAMALTRIAEEWSQITGQVMALVKGAQRQKTSIAGDLSAGKISANGLMSVEGENQLWYTVCHCWMLRKEVLSSAKPSVHQPFRASFLFSPDKS